MGVVELARADGVLGVSEPGSVGESVEHAVNMGMEAWNTGRYDEAAKWFRDAAAHVETARKAKRDAHVAAVEGTSK